MKRTSPSFFNKSNQGFSLLEVLIAAVILAIVTTLSLFGISKAQSSFQLSNGADTLKVYLEKAFADAKRRNARGDSRAKIRVTSATTFQATIDFNGDGLPETQTITLPKKASFVYDPASPPTATIDWRGNVAEGSVLFNLRSDQSQSIQLELSGNGDTNIQSEFPTLPTVTATPISTDVFSAMVLNGDSAPNLDPSPTPTPTPLPFCVNNQKPETDNCRCQVGKTIDNDGKCK